MHCSPGRSAAGARPTADLPAQPAPQPRLPRCVRAWRDPGCKRLVSRKECNAAKVAATHIWQPASSGISSLQSLLLTCVAQVWRRHSLFEWHLQQNGARGYTARKGHEKAELLLLGCSAQPVVQRLTSNLWPNLCDPLSAAVRAVPGGDPQPAGLHHPHLGRRQQACKLFVGSLARAPAQNLVAFIMKLHS